MAAKNNVSNNNIDLTAYDWVGKGIISQTLLNADPSDDVKIKVPACGWCHPGGGPMEYARDAAGKPTAIRYDAADESAQADYDGDYWTMVGDTGPGKSHWTESGVVEADCLLCHYSDYSFGRRANELTHRNYKWAATAGAKLGTIQGDVYAFDDTAAADNPDTDKGNFKSGTWTGVAPTVSYNTAVLDGGMLDDALMVASPGKSQCVRCHWSPEIKKRGWDTKDQLGLGHDVHASGGVDCMDCHGMTETFADGNPMTVSSHNIGKGYARLGSVATALDGTMANDCLDCHDGGTAADPTTAHDGAFGMAAFHFDRISCESCHIPEKAYTDGELIDMSSGNQVWYLSSGDTIMWAGDFAKNNKPWRPYNKPYDPDGDGPLPEKFYPFASKTSVWFGYVTDGGTVAQPYILRHVLAAYNTTAKPKVTVDYVKGSWPTKTDADDTVDGFQVMKPSVSSEADVATMLDYLAASGPVPGATPVLVKGETAYRLDEAGTGIEPWQGISNTETDHNFSISHDIRAADQALGSGGCVDCHTADSTFIADEQVLDLTGYLANSYKDKTDHTYSEPLWEMQGYHWYEADALQRNPAEVNPHAPIVTYDENGGRTCLECHASVPGAFSHDRFHAEYAAAGAGVCITCHTDATEEFKASVHYASRSVVENENFFFPGGGKHGMLDRACALVGSNMLLNMLTTGYLDVADATADTGNPAQQCGGCHTNYYNTLMEPMVAQMLGAEMGERVMLGGVDCLVCHAETYDMALRKTYEDDPYQLNASFGTVEGQAKRIVQDRSAAALASIEGQPSDEMCLRCHEHGRTDYKRGELPEPDHDIHYELGVSANNPCTFCHEVEAHKFNRGAMVNGDIFASDYPVNGDANDAACANCHTDTPHGNSRLNDHVDKLACETCHITYTAGAATTIWADGGFLALAKGTDNLPVKLYTKKEDANNLTPEELWENYKQRPIYMPFSGLTSFLAQSVPITNNNPMMTGGEPIAPKVFPFKTIINPLPFDGRFFGIGVVGVDSDGDGINDYSMFAAMRMFADQYKALGFMDADFDFTAFEVNPANGMLATTWPMNDPAFPSYASMAQMAAFPNMLFFDKYTFGYNWYQNLQTLADAGLIEQWDADYRPLAVKDMRMAVQVGMSRLLDMMVQMGFTAPEGMSVDMMKAMYGKYDADTNPYGITEDQLVVMAAPPGSEMQMMLQQMKDAGLTDISDTLIQNYPAWSNGVTLGGHGVRRDEALLCTDCHSEAEGANVFDQKVEVPAYGDNGMPLMQWAFYSAELLDAAEAGRNVEDVVQAGYVLNGTPFEMGVSFRTAGQDAADLGITYGLGGDYLAVLTPVTRLVSNWQVLGYSDARIAELTNRATGDSGGDDTAGSDSSNNSTCFVQVLGGSTAGVGAWFAGILAAVCGVGILRRR